MSRASDTQARLQELEDRLAVLTVQRRQDTENILRLQDQIEKLQLQIESLTHLLERAVEAADRS